MTDGVIVNIRPALYRERFHEAFARVGWRIVDSPVLAPEATAAELPDPSGYDAVIFTSQVAVDMLGDGSAWREKTAYAVGPATADAARRAGFSRTVQTGLDSKDLIDVLATADFSRAFYPSAEDVSADVSLGDPVRIRRMAVYRMTPSRALSADVLKFARDGGPVLVPLFSRRSARTVECLLGEAGISAQNSRLGAVAISADVLGADAGPWQRRGVADKPTLEAVVEKAAAMAAELAPGARP
jgi:uroporphyrinogen-III synthase